MRNNLMTLVVRIDLGRNSAVHDIVQGLTRENKLRQLEFG
jgi:hypothetical protein